LPTIVHTATASPLDRRPVGRPYFQPSLIKDLGGVSVGIVGIDVKGKALNALNPSPYMVSYDEATASQKPIDLLKYE
jgi:5'-nucleotidase